MFLLFALLISTANTDKDSLVMGKFVRFHVEWRAIKILMTMLCRGKIIMELKIHVIHIYVVYVIIVS